MASFEQLVLDSLALNDPAGAYLIRDPLQISPPRKRQLWAQGGDADGDLLIRDPKFERRTVSFKLRVNPQASMDNALAQVGAIVDKLEECERNQRGLNLVWTPAGSAKSVTIHVLSGEIEEIPVARMGEDRGYFRFYPTLSIRLDCEPFLYVSETLSAVATTTNPAVYTTLAAVPGDVAAESRLIGTDLASQSRRWFEWGVQNRFYDAGTSLEQKTATMTLLAATSTTRAGSYSTNVYRTTLTTTPTGCVSTGNLGHVGVFRVIGRVHSDPASGNASDIQMRLSWQDGDGPFHANPYTSSPVAALYGRVDLGLVTISQAQSGTQKWSGRIEAFSVAAGDTFDIDALFFVPALEGYGVARAAYSYSFGSLAARDEFTSITAGTVLNARVAPAGGTWATSGSTTDFTASDNGFGSGSEEETRATTSDTGNGRFAILGSTNFTDTEVGVTVMSSVGWANTLRGGPVARWVDANNFVYAYPSATTAGPLKRLFVVTQVVAGTPTNLASVVVTTAANTAYQTRLICFASGRVLAWLMDSNGGTIAMLDATSSAVATGGALASGKPGFFDLNSAAGAATRYYDNFVASTPAAEPIVIYSGKLAEVRYDVAQRQDSTGTYYGPVPSYLGDRFYLPCAGGPNRTSRIAMIAHRNDLLTQAWEPITDNTQMQVGYTSRYLAVPR